MAIRFFLGINISAAAAHESPQNPEQVTLFGGEPGRRAGSPCPAAPPRRRAQPAGWGAAASRPRPRAAEGSAAPRLGGRPECGRRPGALGGLRQVCAAGQHPPGPARPATAWAQTGSRGPRTAQTPRSPRGSLAARFRAPGSLPGGAPGSWLRGVGASASTESLLVSGRRYTGTSSGRVSPSPTSPY